MPSQSVFRDEGGSDYVRRREGGITWHTQGSGKSQAVTPMFNALAIGISSCSTVRPIRLYSICNPINGDQPRTCASVFACAIHQAGASEMPV